MQGQNGTSTAGPSTSTSVADIEEEEEDDDLDMDELNELEASLSKASIQIKEPQK